MAQPESIYREAGVANPYYNMPGSYDAQMQYGIPPVLVQDQPYATAAYRADPYGGVQPLIGYPSVYPHVLNGVPMDYSRIGAGDAFALGGNYGYDPAQMERLAMAMLGQFRQGAPAANAAPAQTGTAGGAGAGMPASPDMNVYEPDQLAVPSDLPNLTALMNSIAAWSAQPQMHPYDVWQAKLDQSVKDGKLPAEMRQWLNVEPTTRLANLFEPVPYMQRPAQGIDPMEQFLLSLQTGVYQPVSPWQQSFQALIRNSMEAAQQAAQK